MCKSSFSALKLGSQRCSPMSHTRSLFCSSGQVATAFEPSSFASQVEAFETHACHANTHAMQTRMPCKHACHANTHVMQECRNAGMQTTGRQQR